jgi:hypothetical protein
LTAPSERLGRHGAQTIGGESSVLNEKGGSIAYRFHARDLLVMGPAAVGSPVCLWVTMDGATPDRIHGADTDAEGAGVVERQRLYQAKRRCRRPHVQD